MIRARQFFDALDEGKDAEFVRWDPAVAAAFRIAESDNPFRRLVIEGYLLARLTSAEVAAMVALPLDVVQAYLKIFFDCEHRLDDSRWVMKFVMGIDAAQNMIWPQPECVWKLVCYLTGPFPLEVLVAELRQRPLRIWPIAETASADDREGPAILKLMPSTVE